LLPEQVGVLELEPELGACSERRGDLRGGLAGNFLLPRDDLRYELRWPPQHLRKVGLSPAARVEFVGQVLPGREHLGNHRRTHDFHLPLVVINHLDDDYHPAFVVRFELDDEPELVIQTN